VFITVAQKDFDLKNDMNTQTLSPLTFFDEYLADLVDDQMYPVNQEMEQSTDAVGPSLTESKKVILKFDRNDGPSNIGEERLLLLKESNMVHQERLACVENPATIEGDKNGAELVYQERMPLGFP